MKNYIVFDLEWNQGEKTRDDELSDLPFEIVEIGAVKLNEQLEIIDTFSRLVKPQVYHEMHKITEKLIHLTMKDLEKGDIFIKVADDFLKWCGEDPAFCTWGPLDLPELQRNMEYYNMEPIADGPLPFFDVQKLFSLEYENGKLRRALEFAIDFKEIPKDQPFHRALSDAVYTARIFQGISERIRNNYSFDNYVTPKDKRQEIHIVFEKYAKYISREFDTREELLSDSEVMSTRCYICHKNIRRKIKWFSPNGGKYYIAVSYCNEHGYMKSKIRVKKSENDKLYVVKTSKFISEEDKNELKDKKERYKQRMKKIKK
ncbi:MAG: exonuclease domain-containing protein [Butyrivibrio sp.]|nr:exonuclease domain-containing protein [Butyrivibrio sp.]